MRIMVMRSDEDQILVVDEKTNTICRIVRYGNGANYKEYLCLENDVEIKTKERCSNEP